MPIPLKISCVAPINDRIFGEAGARNPGHPITLMMRLLWIASPAASGPGPLHGGLPEISLEAAADGLTGLNALRHSSYDVALADFPLTGWTPEELLEELKRASPITPVVIRQRAGSFPRAGRRSRRP